MYVSTLNLPNGLTRVRCWRSGLVGLYVTATGAYHCGDLRNVPAHVITTA